MNTENQKHTHGGNIYKASRKHNMDVGDILDFSANINPLGVPEMLKNILVSNIGNLVDYPDTECTALKSEISKYLNISRQNIIIGNGASEIIFLLFDVLRPERVLIPAPTFSEYAEAAFKYEAETRYVKLTESNGFKLIMDDFINQITDKIDCVLLCNPNNPTSTLIATSDLLKLLKHAKERNIFVIVDEAFIELTEGCNNNSVIKFINEYDNLFVIRAFTKVFAIPGLRLGYGAGSKTIIKKMWEYKLPWSVNSLACSVGSFLNRAGGYMDKTHQWLATQKKYLYCELSKFSKLKVFEPQTNFILVKIQTNSLTSDKLSDRMAKKGVLIRDASNFMFLNNKFFRVAVKDAESNKGLLKVLREELGT